MFRRGLLQVAVVVEGGRSNLQAAHGQLRVHCAHGDRQRH